MDLAWRPEAVLSSKEEIPQTVPTLRKKLAHLPINNNNNKSQHLQKLHTFSALKYMIRNLKLIWYVNLSHELSVCNKPDTCKHGS